MGCLPRDSGTVVHLCLTEASKTIKMIENVFLPRAYSISSTEIAVVVHSYLLLMLVLV